MSKSLLSLSYKILIDSVFGGYSFLSLKIIYSFLMLSGNIFLGTKPNCHITQRFTEEKGQEGYALYFLTFPFILKCSCLTAL